MTHFCKYHGLGNDFIVLERDRADTDLDREAIADLCARHRGVGADGILVLTPDDRDEVDATMVVYNRDGSRPEMCGNGIRCAARHLVERSDWIDDEDAVEIATDAGRRPCRITGRHPWRIEAAMGSAEVADAPLDLEREPRTWTMWPVDVGNPHGVCFDDCAGDALEALGRFVNEYRPAPFDAGANLECVEVLDDDTLRISVYERGVGFTEACGTGACAAAAAARAIGRCTPDGPITVRLPGGSLDVAERDDRLWLEGPAEAVFRGTLLAHQTK